MPPRLLAWMGLLVLLTSAGCGRRGTGPGSGPGEQDPEEQRRMRAEAVAEDLRQRYSAAVGRRKDGKWAADFLARPITDAELASLDELTPLAELNLTYTRISDIPTLRLRRFKELERLILLGTAVGDAGLKELATLQELRALGVGIGTTDAGLPLLATFKKLDTLALSGAPISDDALKELKKLSNLTILSLS